MDSDFSLLADKPASRLFSTLYPGAGEDPCFFRPATTETRGCHTLGKQIQASKQAGWGLLCVAWNLWGAFPLCCRDLAMHQRRIYPMFMGESDVS